MNKDLTLAIVMLLISTSVSGQSASSSQTDLTPETSNSLAKLGLSIIIGSQENISSSSYVNSNSPDAKMLGDDLGKLVSSYKRRVNDAAFISSLVSANNEVIITGVQVLASSTPVTAVPAAAVATVARYGNEKFASYLADDGKQRALGVFSAGLQKMSTSDKKKFDNYIAQNKPEQAAKLFDDRTKGLSKLSQSLKDYPGADAVARDYVTKILGDTTSTALILAGKSYALAGNVDERLKNHILTTQTFTRTLGTRVDSLHQSIRGVNQEINQVTSDLLSLRGDQTATAHQVRVIEEIMFEQLPPAAKLKLLEGGAKPGLTSEQRNLTERYLRLEIKKAEVSAIAGQVVSVVSDVNSIMSNLGIEDKGLSDAARYGSAASSALSQAMTGNYLGAIVSITGVFGPAKPDPVQQQFKAVFAELSKINAKLDEIIELQKSTLKAIEQLSAQLALVERNLHDRLDRIDFELKVINAATLITLWGEYQPCMLAWDKRNIDAYDFDTHNLSFKSLRGLQNFVGNEWGQAFTCASKLRGTFSHLRNAADFGNPLRLEFAMSLIAEAPPPGEDLTYVKSDIHNFVTNVHEPSANFLINSWAERNAKTKTWGSVTGAFGLLAAPVRTSRDLQSRIEMLDSGKSVLTEQDCKNSSLLHSRAKLLLCADGTEDRAVRRTNVFLRQPIIRDQVAHLVKWAGMMSSPSEFAPGGSPNAPPATLDQLLSRTAVPVTAPGVEILEGALMMSDISIAQQAMVYGDLTAYFILETLWDPSKKTFKEPSTPREKEALQLVNNKNNPWLSRNVALLLLQSTERLCKGTKCNNNHLKYEISIAPLFKLNSGSAGGADYAPATVSQRVQVKNLMLAMFDLSEEAAFQEADSNPAGIPVPRRIIMKLGSVSLQLPTVDDWAEKRFDYPVGMLERVRERNILAERWAEYTLFDGISAETKTRMIRVLAKGNR